MVWWKEKVSSWTNVTFAALGPTGSKTKHKSKRMGGYQLFIYHPKRRETISVGTYYTVGLAWCLFLVTNVECPSNIIRTPNPTHQLQVQVQLMEYP
jgi:hypothetical protein